jgi:hypothetical protein
MGIGVILAAMPVVAAGAAPDAVAFARISSTGSVVSFGGTKTKTATASRSFAGDS